MYVRESLRLEIPFESCSEALQDPPEQWIPGAVTALDEPSRDLLARLGFSVLGLDVTKQVRMQVGETSLRGDWLRIPIRWHAEPVEQAFPAFDGEIELVTVDPGVTRLVLAGTYEPPLGAVGRSLDNAVMKAAARATIRRLARELARVIRRRRAADTHPTGA